MLLPVGRHTNNPLQQRRRTGGQGLAKTSSVRRLLREVTRLQDRRYRAGQGLQTEILGVGMERKRKLLGKAKAVQLLCMLWGPILYCDCIHHLHRFTEDEDKVLIHYQRWGDKEKVGDGEMKEGNRAQQVCCGDEGHIRLARLKKSGGIDIEALRFQVLRIIVRIQCTATLVSYFRVPACRPAPACIDATNATAA